MENSEHSENEFMLREGFAVDTYNGTVVFMGEHMGHPFQQNISDRVATVFLNNYISKMF